jgi:hypothetical protein
MLRRVFVAAALAAALVGVVNSPAKATVKFADADVNCGTRETATAWFRAGGNSVWDIWETTTTGQNSGKTTYTAERGQKVKVWVPPMQTMGTATIHVYDPNGTVSYTGEHSCSASNALMVDPPDPGGLPQLVVPDPGYCETRSGEGCESWSSADHLSSLESLPSDTVTGLTNAANDPPPILP